MRNDAVLIVEAMTPSMCPEVISWAGDSTTKFHWTGNTWPYPVGISEFESHVAAIESDRSRTAFALRDDRSRRLIGYFEIGGVDLENHFGRLERFLLDPTMRGLGLGQTAMHVIEDQFFDDRRMHRLELVVATDNLPAITCYERAGFHTEGTLRESRKFEEEWRSVQIMSLLRNEWEASR